MLQLTQNQVLEKYGNLKFKFNYYFKFSFLFIAKIENKELFAYVGGNADDIYRLEVDTEEKELKNISFDSFSVYENNLEIENFCSPF